jgi:hypothetical protein
MFGNTPYFGSVTALRGPVCRTFPMIRQHRASKSTLREMCARILARRWCLEASKFHKAPSIGCATSALGYLEERVTNPPRGFGGYDHLAQDTAILPANSYGHARGTRLVRDVRRTAPVTID